MYKLILSLPDFWVFVVFERFGVFRDFVDLEVLVVFGVFALCLRFVGFLILRETCIFMFAVGLV